MALTIPAAEEVRAVVVYLVRSSMTRSTMAGRPVSAAVCEERQPTDWAQEAILWRVVVGEDERPVV